MADYTILPEQIRMNALQYAEGVRGSRTSSSQGKNVVSEYTAEELVADAAIIEAFIAGTSK